MDERRSRPRDSAGSRERLLDAAIELIGDRAGVDPAMIARYFGGKAKLFAATLQAEGAPASPGSLLDASTLASLVERTGRQGPGPILQVAVRPYSDRAAQATAFAELGKRLLTPLRKRLASEGDEQPDLHAEVLTAAFVGVVLARRAGALEHLAEASNGELFALLHSMLGAS
jgi:AcrR family transcriptional regulator